MGFRNLLLLSFCLILPTNALAENVAPYVVSASRFALPENQVGADVTVITAEEIQSLHAGTVADVLNTVPGVDVVYQGNGVASVFARGSRSSSLMVLVDGVPVNDPSYPSFDFGRMSLVNVERVEVVLGAQSAIYGANALSGVVNIISKQGQGDLSGFVYAEAGVPTQSKIEAGLGAGNEMLAWSLGVQGRYNKMFSEAPSRFGNNEKDQRLDGVISGSLNFTPSDIFSIKADVRADKQAYDYDAFTLDSPARFYSERYLGRLTPTLELFDGMWVQKLDVSYVDSRSHTKKDTFGDNKYHGSVFRGDWQHKVDLDWQSFVFGGLWQYEKNFADRTNNPFGDNSSQSSWAIYGEYTVNPLDNLYLTAAWRMDDSDIFGTEHSYSGSLAYTVASSGTFFHASVGKSYKTPSLQELYGPWGNKDLKAEQAYTWDFGLSQPFWDNKAEIYATYYQASYRNLISYSYALGKSFNYDRVDAQGLEAGFKLYPIEGLSIKAAGTFAKTYVKSTDKPQLRQPNVSLRTDVDYTLPLNTEAKYTIGFTWTLVGAREDIDDTFATVRVPAYNLVDLRFKGQFTDNFSLYTKVGNIFNQKYEAVWGYSSPGISGLIGLEWKF